MSAKDDISQAHRSSFRRSRTRESVKGRQLNLVARSLIRSICTVDVDEARAMFCHVYSELSIEIRSGTAFNWEAEIQSAGTIQFTTGIVSGGCCVAVADTSDRSFIMMVSDGGMAEVDHAGVCTTIVPNRLGALLSPSRPAKVQMASWYQPQNLIIAPGTFEAHLMTLTGYTSTRPIAFDVAIDFETRNGAAVYDIIRIFRRVVSQIDASPLLVATLRDTLLTCLLTNVNHSASRFFEPTPRRVSPGTVKRAEEFMAANVTEPITLAQITAAAGSPERTLRAAFVARHGMSPMAFLRQRRFELARLRLAEAPPGTTVLSIVKVLGLGDAGRFSVEYRKRFGESPAETLARGRAGVSPQGARIGSR